jgi:hypothetical protein
MFRSICILCCILLTINVSFAQKSKGKSTSAETKVSSKNITPPGNFIKFNLAGLALRNYSFQYERSLSKKISLALGVRIMPAGSLPLLSSIEQLAGNDEPDFVSAVRSININSTAYTPEVRWYPGKKGYGRGFYMAAYYRYLKMDLSSSKQFKVEIDNDPRNITLASGIQAHNIGLMMGAQWMLSKRLFLDWWIMGIQAGFQKGSLLVTPDIDFTDAQIAEIQNDISVNFTALGQTTAIDRNRVNIQTNSFLPVTGLRAGLCIGVRF